MALSLSSSGANATPRRISLWVVDLYWVSMPRPIIDLITLQKEFITDNFHASVLKLLATSPSYQRRGAASLMLAWGTELADRQGLVCWTVASSEGLSLYQKFGFKVHDSVMTPMLSGVTYTSTCIMRERIDSAEEKDSQ